MMPGFPTLFQTLLENIRRMANYYTVLYYIILVDMIGEEAELEESIEFCANEILESYRVIFISLNHFDRYVNKISLQI